MSAYEDEWICPKCRHYSTNPDSCVHCGALISRILERENARGFSDSESAEDKGASLSAHEVPQQAVSFTAIVLVLVLLALAAIFYYYQTGGFDSETEASVIINELTCLKQHA